MNDSSPSSKTYVVTLVHGTWARRADWLKPDAPIRAHLLNALRGDVLVVPFYWSGRNTYAARYRAALELRTHLKELHQQHPASRHIVIAHSHGGFVALKAVEHAGLTSTTRVACLSTPFLHTRDRDIGTWGASGLFAALGLMAAFASGAILDVGFLTNFSLASVGIVAFSKFLLCSLPGGLLAVGAEFVCMDWYEGLHTRTDLVVAPEQEVLIIRSVADEASAALSSIQFMSWLVNRISKVYLVFASKVRDLHSKAVDSFGEWVLTFSETQLRLATLPPLIAVIVILAAVVHGPFELGTSVALQCAAKVGLSAAVLTVAVYAFALLFVASSLIVPVLLLMPAVPMLVVLSAVSLLLGIETFLISVCRDISVETTPLGSWEVHQINPEFDESSFGLLHSATYTQPAALKLITQWIVQ